MSTSNLIKRANELNVVMSIEQAGFLVENLNPTKPVKELAKDLKTLAQEKNLTLKHVTAIELASAIQGHNNRHIALTKNKEVFSGKLYVGGYSDSPFRVTIYEDNQFSIKRTDGVAFDEDFLSSLYFYTPNEDSYFSLIEVDDFYEWNHAFFGSHKLKLDTEEFSLKGDNLEAVIGCEGAISIAPFASIDHRCRLRSVKDGCFRKDLDIRFLEEFIAKEKPDYMSAEKFWETTAKFNWKHFVDVVDKDGKGDYDKASLANFESIFNSDLKLVKEYEDYLEALHHNLFGILFHELYTDSQSDAVYGIIGLGRETAQQSVEGNPPTEYIGESFNYLVPKVRLLEERN